MKVRDIIAVLEATAPLDLQESYDNAGLIVGDVNMALTGVLLCLDSIEEIIDEAIERGCNMVVAHHPIVFSGIKKITGSNYIERVIIKAIKNDIAIYASHTNLDKVYKNGVNETIAAKIGLKNTSILAPEKGHVFMLVAYVPVNHKEQVLTSMYSAGAGEIGEYSNCSFSSAGEGTFMPLQNANPFIGEEGVIQKEAEERVEVLVVSNKVKAVLAAMKDTHPYEEVAHYIIPVENAHQNIGLGMVGELAEELEVEVFLQRLKEQFNLPVIRHTNYAKKIKKVAVCGGSGSFLFNDVSRCNADAYVTADIKYHQFFDPEGKFLLADIGHYESEKFTLEIFHRLISEKFPTFAVLFTDRNSNPVNYF